MLKNDYLLAKIDADTAENEPRKERRVAKKENEEMAPSISARKREPRMSDRVMLGGRALLSFIQRANGRFQNDCSKLQC